MFSIHSNIKPLKKCKSDNSEHARTKSKAKICTEIFKIPPRISVALVNVCEHLFLRLSETTPETRGTNERTNERKLVHGKHFKLTRGGKKQNKVGRDEK
jgi:hypothetical protein